MVNLGQVAGVVTRPLTAVHGVDVLLTQLGQVATRALALLDVVEPVASRIGAVVGTAETAAARVESVVTRAEQAAAQVDALTAKAAKVAARAEKATAEAASIVTDVQPLVAAVARLDPALVARLAPLLEDAQALLPALQTLPAVLDRLAGQVDYLEKSVAEVGALLSGIPGAARLVKRGGDRLTGR